MLVILDTNILIDIEKGFEKTILQLKTLTSELVISEPAITWISYYEFSFGAKNDKKSDDFLNNFVFLDMTKEATTVFTKLKKQNLSVRDFDLLISSVVIAHGGLLITKDRDFQNVPGLNVKIF